jgi:FkbM family methyltransferase
MATPILHRLLLRLRGGRLITHFNISTTREINGRRVLLPLMGDVGFNNLVTSEPWLDVVLQRLFARKTATFVDVGANVGQTLLKVKTLAPHIRYVGFEPNPVCVRYTQRLIELNHFETCTLLPVGLSSRPALLRFFAESEADVSGSVVEGMRPRKESMQKIYVPVFDGDRALEMLHATGVGVLKIDVEGGELEVVEGLRRTIQRDSPFIIAEILPLFSATDPKCGFRKPRQEQLIVTMRDAGYLMYRLREDGTAQPMSDIEIHDDMRLTNYLFAPIEEAPMVAAQMVSPVSKA